MRVGSALVALKEQSRWEEIDRVRKRKKKKEEREYEFVWIDGECKSYPTLGPSGIHICVFVFVNVSI